MMMGDPDPSGLQPELLDRILPRRKLRSFVTYLSIVQVILFIVTVIVGGVKFHGNKITKHALQSIGINV